MSLHDDVIVIVLCIRSNISEPIKVDGTPTNNQAELMVSLSMIVLQKDL